MNNETFEIKPATRVGVKPLIVAFSESGCGKTYSALLLARGLAGPSGKIVVADSESRRASLYADVIPGGFETFDLCEPFTPARYIAAVNAIEDSGAAVGILDSGSHEWEGIGGVLEMAGDNEQRSGKPGLHNWKTPKFEHAKFVQRLLRTKIPFIICLRAKYKSRQGKDDRGKTVIIKDDFTSPIQAEDFIFEATAHFEILPNHSIRLTKCSHPALAKCFPDKAPIEIKHGELIGKWCEAPSGGAPTTTTKPEVSAELKAAKKKVWDLTQSQHGGDVPRFKQWLIDEALIDPDAALDELTAVSWSVIYKKAQSKLTQPA